MAVTPVAFALHLPTDTTDAIDSFRDGQTGLIVKPLNPGGLADATTPLSVDPYQAKTYGAEACTWVVEDFQPESVVTSLMGFSGKSSLRPAGARTETPQ